MNSFFYTLLERYDISKHDGRPLWKYNLTDDDYMALKDTISKASRSSIDPRDLTLLYAEWWKNEYEGGFPTKRRVYGIIEDCSIHEDDFYALAKQGAVMLGIKWIQRGRRLFFRTLLLQGGVPVNHMIKNSGQYTNFLKKVMELKPDSIEEFAYDSDITKLLPISSRNEDVFESCLQIVKAIWDGNEEYTAILDAKQQSGNNSITKQLKDYKEQIEKTIKRRVSVKAYWVLSLDKNNNASVNIKINLPQVIDNEALTQILGLKGGSELKTEYHLIVDDKLLAKLKKNLAGNFKVFLFNNSSYAWQGDNLNPEVKMRDTSGFEYPLPILSANAPALDEPTLWVEKTDCDWILMKGKACKNDEGFILYPENWNFESNYAEETKTIELFQKNLGFVKFSNLISFSSDDNEPLEFKTKVKSFEWVIQEYKPTWLLRSNIPAVKDSAKIIVYKEDGSKINNEELFWRLTGTKVWQPWTQYMPIGCIEYKIILDGLEEKGHFCNIGNFNLEVIDTSVNHAEIQLTNGQNFNFTIEEEHHLSVNHSEHAVEIALTDYNKMPKSIKAKLRKESQVRAFHFEIAQPFSGVKILDPEEQVMEHDGLLLLGNFNGYRILSPTPNDYFVRMYNENNPDIKVIKKLPGGTSPLRIYNEEVYKLIRLSDSMDRNTSVSIEFFEVSGKNEQLLGKYVVRAFNRFLHYSVIDDKLIINLTDGNNEELSLFAIPLECSPRNIELIPLEKDEQGYVFPDIFLVNDKFIVVSELSNNTDVLKPAFVSTSKGNHATTMIDKEERIMKEKTKLPEQFNYWEKIHKYFDFCVQLELPFTTFDIFRAAVKTPELTAKLFCYLCVNAYSDTFLDTDIKNLEEDLGVCFHWVSAKDWDNAIKWLSMELMAIGESEANIAEIVKLTRDEIQKMIKANEPFKAFESIANFIINNRVPNFSFDVLRQIIQDLRADLGEKVLNELPANSPTIPEEFKAIIPVDETNWVVKTLLKVPVAVALSMAGKDKGLWLEDAYFDKIRRNVQFVHWLAPQWYGLAILHSLNRINNL